MILQADYTTITGPVGRKICERPRKHTVRPASGLPDLSLADEAGDGAVAPEVPARSETAATAIPAAAVQTARDVPRENRPHPIYAAASHPAFLLGGGAVVLISILWLLFGGTGGTADPDVPGQDGAGTRLEASGSELGTQVVNPAGESASRGSDTAPVSTRAAAASDSATAPSTPPSADGAASTGVPPADGLPTAVSDAPSEPVAARSDSPPPSGSATSSAVVAAEICSQLDTRAADGAPLAEWRCEPVVDRAAPGRLSFYTRIRSRTSTTVEHRWLRNGVLEQQVTLDVGANDGPGYRTYSSHTVSPEARGTWRVELRLGDQESLHVEEFVVP